MDLTNKAAIALGIGLIVAPVVTQYFKPKVQYIFNVDVSQSNQKNAEYISSLCQKGLDNLIDGDRLVKTQFADISYTERNSDFKSQNLAQLKKECATAVKPAEGLGKHKGTDILAAVRSVNNTIQGNQKAMAVFAFNAFEDVEGKTINEVTYLADLKTEVSKLSDKDTFIVFIGAQPEYQNQLRNIVIGMNNIQVCTFWDGQECQELAFNEARKTK